MRLPALALLAGCGPVTAATQQPLTPGCVDPQAYGAVPDDGLSDRVAIQAALNQPGPHTVCLAAGTWDVDRAPIGSYNRFAALSTHATGVSLVGVGTDTVLRLAGNQGNGAVTVVSVDPSATDITVADLVIDTTLVTNTDEQTHAIATSAVCSGTTCKPITNVSIHGVTFRHPATPGMRKGDCVRLLGSTLGTQVTGVTIENNDFADCARSAVVLQRGLHDVRITGNRINCVTCDQAIDGEASGGTVGADENSGLEIAGNTFTSGPLTQGDYDISVTGSGDPYRDVHIHDNVLSRGIRLYRTANVEVDHEAITLNARFATGVIEVGNVCSGLSVHDVELKRRGVTGPMLRLIPQSGGLCGNAVIRDSVLTQDTAGVGIVAEAASDLTLARLTMAWHVPSALQAVSVRATVAPIVGLAVTSSLITGPVKTGIRLDAAPYGISGASVTGTTAVGGMTCTGAGGVTAATSCNSTARIGTRRTAGR